MSTPPSTPPTTPPTTPNTTPNTTPTATPLTLRAADGYPIAARRYEAVGEPLGQVIFAGATGVPQGFYRRFALYAAEHGYTTLTLDYRGLGHSRPETLRGFEMDFLDWAELDLAAAVDAVPADGGPLHLVGHSFGGHAFGLLPNAERIRSAHLFGTGAGWHGWMPRLEQVRVLAMWNLLGPALTWWKGYLNWSVVGLGEDLPMDVYRTWRRWCRHPRYFFDDPDYAHLAERFERIRTPITAVNATDDRWSPPASRDAFMSGYRNAPLLSIDLDPRAAGLGPIGHMGYFRPAAEPLWRQVIDDLGELRAAA